MLFGLMFLLPVLEWQAVVLRAYRRALEDTSFREELDRKLARMFLEAYLEHSRSKPEGSGITTGAMDLLHDFLRVLEGAVKQLESALRPPQRP